MTCDEFLESIEDLALGSAEPDRSGALRAHAASCPACAARLAETEGLNARLRGLRTAHSLPPGLRDRVLDTIVRAGDGVSVAPFATRLVRLWRWAPAAAALLLFAAFAALFVSGPGPAVPAVVADTLVAYDGLATGVRALGITSGDARAIQAYFGSSAPDVPSPRCCARCTCPPDGCACRLRGGGRCALTTSGVQAPCVVYDHAGVPIAMLHVGPVRLEPGALASAKRHEHDGHTVYRFQCDGVNVAVCLACDPSRLWVSRLDAETLVAAAHGMMRQEPRDPGR